MLHAGITTEDGVRKVFKIIQHGDVFSRSVISIGKCVTSSIEVIMHMDVITIEKHGDSGKLIGSVTAETDIKFFHSSNDSMVVASKRIHCFTEHFHDESHH